MIHPASFIRSFLENTGLSFGAFKTNPISLDAAMALYGRNYVVIPDKGLQLRKGTAFENPAHDEVVDNPTLDQRSDYAEIALDQRFS